MERAATRIIRDSASAIPDTYRIGRVIGKQSRHLQRCDSPRGVIVSAGYGIVGTATNASQVPVGSTVTREMFVSGANARSAATVHPG